MISVATSSGVMNPPVAKPADADDDRIAGGAGVDAGMSVVARPSATGGRHRDLRGCLLVSELTAICALIGEGPGYGQADAFARSGDVCTSPPK